MICIWQYRKLGSNPIIHKNPKKKKKLVYFQFDSNEFFFFLSFFKLFFVISLCFMSEFTRLLFCETAWWQNKFCELDLTWFYTIICGKMLIELYMAGTIAFSVMYQKFLPIAFHQQTYICNQIIVLQALITLMTISHLPCWLIAYHGNNQFSLSGLFT